MPTPPTTQWDWKSWVGVAIGLVSLILGSLILESRPTLSLDAPTKPEDILSTQAIISNDGALPLEDVDVAVFIRKIQGPKYSAGPTTGTRYQPPSREMNIGDKKTIRISPVSIYVGTPIVSVDVGLIVCYRPDFVPAWMWMWFGKPKVFRFDSARFADGTSKLRQQPDDGKLLSEYERFAGVKACAPN